MTDLRLCLSKMSRLKLSVIGQSSSHKLKDEKAQGILGGDKKLRCVLSNATKSSSVLTKAVVPKRVAKRDRDDVSSPKRRTHALSRSRSQDKAKRGDRKDVRYSWKSSNSGNREQQEELQEIWWKKFQRDQETQIQLF